MKTKSGLFESLGGYLCRGVATAAVLASCALPLYTRAAAFDSPAGTWDISISGNRQGVAQMEFLDGGSPSTRTFSIFEIVVPNQPSSPSSDTESRGTGGDDSRNGPTGGTNTSFFVTNLFGGEFVSNGQWGFDQQGRVIGFYGEVLAEVCTTNIVTITNTADNFPINGFGAGFVTNVASVNCTATTNAVSFTGSVVPGKRLTLSARIGSERFIYQGLPLIQLTNLSGTGFGYRIQPGQNTTEFFTLSASSMINAYDIFGGGGNYGYNVIGGTALLSRWNKIGFGLFLDPDGSVARGTVGGFNKRRLSFSTQGWEQSSGAQNGHIRFNGAITPAPVD